MRPSEGRIKRKGWRQEMRTRRHGGQKDVKNLYSAFNNDTIKNDIETQTGSKNNGFWVIYALDVYRNITGSLKNKKSSENLGT